KIVYLDPRVRIKGFARRVDSPIRDGYNERLSGAQRERVYDSLLSPYQPSARRPVPSGSSSSDPCACPSTSDSSWVAFVLPASHWRAIVKGRETASSEVGRTAATAETMSSSSPESKSRSSTSARQITLTSSGPRCGPCKKSEGSGTTKGSGAVWLQRSKYAGRSAGAAAFGVSNSLGASRSDRVPKSTVRSVSGCPRFLFFPAFLPEMSTWLLSHLTVLTMVSP